MGVDQAAGIFGTFNPGGALLGTECGGLAMAIKVCWFHAAKLAGLAAGKRFLGDVDVVFNHTAAGYGLAQPRAGAGAAWVAMVTVSIASALATLILDAVRLLGRAMFAGGTLYAGAGRCFGTGGNKLVSCAAPSDGGCQNKEYQGVDFHGVVPFRL